MYKLVVSKFEGALIDREEAISTSTVLEIDNIRRKGVFFAVFTDGSFKDVLNYNVDFPFMDYIIAYEGAYLFDAKGEKAIYQKKIEKKILKDIVTNFPNYQIYGFTENEKVLITDFKNQDIYKLEIECPSKKILNQIVCKLEELNLNISYSTKKVNTSYIIGIIMNTASCSFALEKICNMKKIKLEEVVGIGVEDKDISLLEMVGYKVAMGNATTRLKRIADKKTESNNHEGVYQILSQI